MKRRDFLKNSVGLAGLAYAGSTAVSCNSDGRIKGMIYGPNREMGHRLRDASFSLKPSKKISHDVVIVGGGVAGLAAGRILKKHNVDFILLELENHTGGNAHGGVNSISPYPWGAHYLPVPSLYDADLIEFLTECGVITGVEHGKPVYNDFFLCFDPKERLYINGHWQEGLIPRSGLPPGDLAQMNRFHDLMSLFKEAKGADGKEAFCIPVEFCSSDPKFTSLDAISFDAYLERQGFTSEYLLWYVNYCCADDYGALARNTSAWAGIHYFASRKGVASNADPDAVLTWPEGNGWLTKHLSQDVTDHLMANCLVFSIDISEGKVSLLTYDGENGVCTQIIAEHVIMATPQFVNRRILGLGLNRNLDYGRFSYAPWMTANLTLRSYLDNRRGEQLSWDNVIYGSQSLGYVHANHQNISQEVPLENVITYYAPLVGDDVSAQRLLASNRSYDQWYDLVLQDLRRPHPNIEEGIQSVDFWIWGHGMIRPTPGFIFGGHAAQASKPIQDKIFFVHSDCGGISIFEEAFRSGAKVAKQILAM